MNRNTILTALLIAFSLMSFTVLKLPADVYKVDTQQSSLEWFAAKVTGKHNGTIRLAGGEIQNNQGRFSGTFDIDMSSIEDKDMADPTYKKKLENHLKSADFFGVEEYPKSKFVISSVTPIKDAGGAFTHQVKGMLTIKNKTNEISFDATIKIEGNKATCSGSAIVDRAKFDIKYGSKTFFSDIGDKMIYDEFTLKFNVVATK